MQKRKQGWNEKKRWKQQQQQKQTEKKVFFKQTNKQQKKISVHYINFQVIIHFKRARLICT